ncbi:hypothetical protein GCM10011348_40210 [Marinobacterium nitratireducens]|uniref:Uncharacterized protein n=1 Tax=Marinobacterium nitratireducens TaxID=518897 RepID=A0A917ZP07_9GAMM|nr:hypothetical protein GCM10011348_40210 [Marinobacterium nitratireducens]
MAEHLVKTAPGLDRAGNRQGMVRFQQQAPGNAHLLPERWQLKQRRLDQAAFGSEFRKQFGEKRGATLEARAGRNEFGILCRLAGRACRVMPEQGAGL